MVVGYRPGTVVWTGWNAKEEMEDGLRCRWKLVGAGNSLKHEAQIRPQTDSDSQKDCLSHGHEHFHHALVDSLAKAGSSRDREEGRVARVG